MLTDKERQVMIRLAELWTIREKEPLIYSRLKLGVEKENIYISYGANQELINEARKLYYKHLK